VLAAGLVIVLAVLGYGGYRIYRHVEFGQQQARACAASRSAERAESSANSKAVGAPTVAFVGDSYTAGLGATSLAEGWPTIVAKARGWRLELLGVAGTGFANNGPCGGHSAYADRIGDVVQTDPALVIVEGGLNDFGASRASERDLIVSYVNDLRHRLPAAQVVLVGPIAPIPSARPQVEETARAFHDAASRLQVRLVDPEAGRWFGSDPSPFVAADHQHPNDAGQARFAQRLLADLADVRTSTEG
jgi:lysophospholipase L1-like esterase